MVGVWRTILAIFFILYIINSEYHLNVSRHMSTDALITVFQVTGRPSAGLSHCSQNLIALTCHRITARLRPSRPDSKGQPASDLQRCEVSMRKNRYSEYLLPMNRCASNRVTSTTVRPVLRGWSCSFLQECPAHMSLRYPSVPAVVRSSVVCCDIPGP